MGLTCCQWLSVTHGLAAGQKDTPLIQFCGSISIALGGLMSSFRLIDNFFTRSKLSALTRELNVRVRKVKLVMEARGSPLLKEWNQQYVILLILIVVSEVLLVSLVIMILLYAIFTGSTFLQLSLPFERASYSALWWGELIYQLAVIVFCAYFFPLTETISIDSVLQLTFLYRACYEDVQRLSGSGKGVPEKRLTEICCELKMYKE